ncbi:uncharacterized protein [Triticum aestivum]|uniref:uncharacterized protein n=1 Tax=Triticum aestivum TaxID=4565 RepID=UPI001D013E05|nr:uncharacterized protein LOC123056000 [Triticum aestivum]
MGCSQVILKTDALKQAFVQDHVMLLAHTLAAYGAGLENGDAAAGFQLQPSHLVPLPPLQALQAHPPLLPLPLPPSIPIGGLLGPWHRASLALRRAPPSRPKPSDLSTVSPRPPSRFRSTFSAVSIATTSLSSSTRPLRLPSAAARTRRRDAACLCLSVSGPAGACYMFDQMFHLNPPLPSPRTGTLEIRLVLIILYQVCMHLTYRRASFLTQRKGHGSSLLRDLPLDSNKFYKYDQLQSASKLWILAAMPSDALIGNFQPVR